MNSSQKLRLYHILTFHFSKYFHECIVLVRYNHSPFTLSLFTPVKLNNTSGVSLQTRYFSQAPAHSGVQYNIRVPRDQNDVCSLRSRNRRWSTPTNEKERLILWETSSSLCCARQRIKRYYFRISFAMSWFVNLRNAAPNCRCYNL